MAPLLANRTCVVPCRWPKHKKNEGSSQKKAKSRQILLNWVWKQSIKDRNDSDLSRSGGFKPKRSQSESRSDWRELKKEVGFGQELQIEEDQNDWYTTLVPSRVTRFVGWNISPPADNKVFHWSKWFISKTNEGQRLKTLPGRHWYLKCDAFIVTLCTCNQLKHANTSKLPEYNLLIHVSN